MQFSTRRARKPHKYSRRELFFTDSFEKIREQCEFSVPRTMLWRTLTLREKSIRHRKKVHRNENRTFCGSIFRNWGICRSLEISKGASIPAGRFCFAEGKEGTRGGKFSPENYAVYKKFRLDWNFDQSSGRNSAKKHYIIGMLFRGSGRKGLTLRRKSAIIEENYAGGMVVFAAAPDFVQFLPWKGAPML